MRGVFIFGALWACRADIKVETEPSDDIVVVSDLDGDGYDVESDCDDDDSTINPGASEVCDGIDNNCDGYIDENVLLTFFADTDDDGFGNPEVAIESCEQTAGYVPNDSDCDDSNADAYPGNVEVCDGLDNNCDGAIDENIGNSYYLDSDGDGFGNPDELVLSCQIEEGLVVDNTDCDDSNNTIYPNAPEICDSLDNDCDTDVDEDGETLYFLDQDGDGFGDDQTSLLSCAPPSDYVATSGDCDDIDPLIHPTATEICDGIDNNCDGLTDDSTAIGQQFFYADNDGDGFGDANVSVETCNQPNGYVTDDSDCDDSSISVNPSQGEVCDGQDNDCDGLSDADDPSLIDGVTYGLDLDGDGYGSAVITVVECSQPSGYVTNTSDCNDLEATAYPGATEVCDGFDNDCDGLTDDADSDVDSNTQLSYYPDNDGDGFGDENAELSSCSQPVGYIADGTDCDDTDASINPTVVWYADADGDGFGTSSYQTQSCLQPSGYVTDDSDCDDGDALVNPNTTWYIDVDNDGYGSTNYTLTQCVFPAGYVLDDSDCDDTSASVFPSATEVCDGIDNDCDLDIDDDDSNIDSASQGLFYADGDGDGFGDPNIQEISCNQPSGYVLDDSDCDDTDASINPNAVEICDGVDNDCDGSIDPSILFGSGATCPGASCLDILNSIPSATDGVYWIDPQGGNAFEAYCDMTTDGGGWTLLGTVYGGDADNWNTQFGYWSDTNTLSDPYSPWEDYKGQAWIDLDITSAEILWQRRFNATVQGQAVLATDCQDGRSYFRDLFTSWDTSIGCGTSSITVLQSNQTGIRSPYQEGDSYGIAGSDTNGWCWNGGDTVNNTFQGHAGWNQAAYPCYGAGHLSYIGVFNKGSSQYNIEDITTTNWLNGVSNYEQTAISFFAR